MVPDLSARRFGTFEHIFDQVNAATRAVPLIAPQKICGTGRGAEPAMDTRPQDLVGFGDPWVRKLLGCEVGLHGNPCQIGPLDIAASHIGIHTAWIENTDRIKGCL